MINPSANQPALFHRCFFLLLVSLLLTTSGCVDKTVYGDQSTYTFSAWVVPLITVIGIVLIPLGWLFRRISYRAALACFIGGPAMLIFFAPAMYRDRAIVDSNHFESTRGFWWSPEDDNVKFAEIREIRLVTKRERRSTSYTLQCLSRNGGQVTSVPLGNLDRYALPELFERARAAKIIVIEDNN